MDDLISRQAAIDACYAPHMKNADYIDFAQMMDTLPSAQSELSDEEKRLIKQLRTYHNGSYAAVLDKLMPSAQPMRKKGKWMCYGEDGFPNESDVYFWQCDQCFKMQRGRRSTPMAFCPECGADMRGEQNEID